MSQFRHYWLILTSVIFFSEFIGSSYHCVPQKPNHRGDIVIINISKCSKLHPYCVIYCWLLNLCYILFMLYSVNKPIFFILYFSCFVILSLAHTFRCFYAGISPFQDNCPEGHCYHCCKRVSQLRVNAHTCIHKWKSKYVYNKTIVLPVNGLQSINFSLRYSKLIRGQI